MARHADTQGTVSLSSETLSIGHSGGASDWLVEEANIVFRLEFGDSARPCLFTRSEYDALKEYFVPRNADLEARIQPFQPGFRLSRTSKEEEDTLVFRDQIEARFRVRMTRRLARWRNEHEPVQS